jgi:hypothetical protein
MFEVYETDADLTPNKKVFQNISRDLAETKTVQLFQASGYGKDFLVYNKKTMENVAACLTARTKRIRGECQD